jgi:hypothetical protein
MAVADGLHIHKQDLLVFVCTNMTHKRKHSQTGHSLPQTKHSRTLVFVCVVFVFFGCGRVSTFIIKTDCHFTRVVINHCSFSIVAVVPYVQKLRALSVLLGKEKEKYCACGGL